MENNENALTPALAAELKAVSPEDLAAISVDVMEATKVTNRATEELEHLGNCISDFIEVQDEYNKKAQLVKNKIRYLNKHM